MVVLARVLDEQSAAANASAAESALRKRTGAQLQKRKKQLRKAFGRAAARQTPSSLHDARIAAKKLRYISELAEEVSLESGLKKQVRFLKRLQDLLGAHHDVPGNGRAFGAPWKRARRSAPPTSSCAVIAG
jgi:CHAD domain-containing protein